MDIIKVEPDSDSETNRASLQPYGQYIGAKLAAENVLAALPTLKEEVKVRCPNYFFFMDVRFNNSACNSGILNGILKQSDNLIEACRI
jgi:hypothetical protein